MEVKISEPVQITQFSGVGYLPLVDYQSWRVAMLRYIDDLLPERINNLECHLETDEVFVLLAGKCMLFIGTPGGETFADIQAINMEPLKLYNIRQGVYHSHTLSPDASVLIVENQDTGLANSHQILLEAGDRERIITLAKGF